MLVPAERHGRPAERILVIVDRFERFDEPLGGQLRTRFLERDQEQVSRMDQDFPVVVGDGTEEEVLKSAGIERAKGLVTVLLSDADNLFVTLSSRELNPKLKIIARGNVVKAIGNDDDLAEFDAFVADLTQAGAAGRDGEAAIECVAGMSGPGVSFECGVSVDAEEGEQGKQCQPHEPREETHRVLLG